MYFPSNDIISFGFKVDVYIVPSLMATLMANLTIVNSAALNMERQVSLRYAGLEHFGYIPRSGISSFVFGFPRNLYTDFHSS